jgi:hypothetical protein
MKFKKTPDTCPVLLLDNLGQLNATSLKLFSRKDITRGLSIKIINAMMKHQVCELDLRSEPIGDCVHRNFMFKNFTPFANYFLMGERNIYI